MPRAAGCDEQPRDGSPTVYIGTQVCLIANSFADATRTVEFVRIAGLEIDRAAQLGPLIE